jgi:hypothetical protein
VKAKCGHTDGKRHDCKYVEAVNACITEAERLARAEVGKEIQYYPTAFIRWMNFLTQKYAGRKILRKSDLPDGHYT